MIGTKALPLPGEEPGEEPGAQARRSGVSDVFASLVFPASIDADDVRSIRHGVRLALEARGARWQDALLSTDGRRLLGRWRAADAASVSAALAVADIPFAETWSGIDLELTRGVTANVIVEDRREDGAPIRSIFPYDRLGTCLATLGVVPVRVVVSIDGRRLLAFYRAPDTESVRLAQRDGSVCAGRVWGCRNVDPGCRYPASQPFDTR